MTHYLRHTLLLLIATFLLALSAAAQSVNIRYVSTTGDNSKDGTSWANAKKDIQEAINDLAGNNLTGEVWVAAGTYYPTETTETTTSLYYKAFKIPAGITVRGGFAGTEGTAAGRAMTTDTNFGTTGNTQTIDGESFKSGVYQYKTILCGDITPTKKAALTWNEKKQQFDVAFYGNSYHVVWFAMNGFDPATGRANPLSKPAKLEGCIVEGGHAHTRDVLAQHPHTAYGGGIYMVLGSFVYNCEVRNCDASRSGGGIYMDGGGVVRRTYVHDCQTLGLGTEFGYGGGICQNGGALTAKERPCVVAQSVVTNCVGRMGGGIAIMADQTTASGKYAVVSNSTLVNNNTATLEAGGVYTYKGGGVASLTIVNNKCNGSGITQNGTLTGRSGGLYSYDASYVANTVIWGNECEANNDVQFASSVSNLSGTEKIKFYHNAVSKADKTDWSSTTRMGAVALDDNNSTSGTKGNLGYPLFFQPTTAAGYFQDINHDFGDSDPLRKHYSWNVSSESYLTFAGVATIDLDTEGETPAPEHSWDMQLAKFNSRPTIGAFAAQKGDVAPATSIRYNGTTYDYALFVDPEFVYAADNTGTNGATWDHPVRFLGNALDYIKDRNYASGTKVAIFVKEGTVDNTRDAGADRIRITSLDIPSNVSVFGSFDSHLTGTNLTLQNVVHTPTVISARLMDQYNYNVAHLINIDTKSNIHFEGFKLSFANASSTELANTNKNGAAITLTNSSDITFRNIIVSNCTADRGAAVYADHTTDTRFENCIFHNNESKVLDNSGIIYATNGSALTFDHCDVLRNVGHASYLGSNSTTNVWTNSIFYGNMNKVMPDTNVDMGGGITFALAAFSGNTSGATGNHCMFDSKSLDFSTQFGGNDTGNQWQYNLQYLFKDGVGQGYPRFINPTKNAGVTIDGDATYYGRATSFEPHNNNPAVNMASHPGTHNSWGKDIIDITRDFGGLPDIGAVENHEATEGINAYKDGQKAYGEVLYVRDYNTYNDDGTVKTSDTSIANRDGSSWERAINGNGDYTLSGTHTYKDTNLETVMAYKINTGTSPNQYYLDVNSGTLKRVNSATIYIPVIDPETGEPQKDSGGKDITEPYNPVDHCTVFILCDDKGKDLPYNSTVNGTRRLKDASTGEFLYLDYVKSSNTYTFRTSANPPADQAKATITASSTNYRIAYKANNTTKYISNANTIPGTTQTAWTFTAVSLKVDHGTGELVENASYNMGTFKGLQYAVNKAHIAYKDSLSFTADPQKAKKQVWVGAGIYQRDPAKNTVADPIVEMDEENCFIIQNGVDVYGAFPKIGNPGMDQRQALVSQYVHVLSSRNYSPADFETILEPATKGVTSGVKRRVLGQPYKYNPDKGNDTNRGKNGGILYCGMDYVNVVWDGFTLREGVYDSQGLNRPNRYGGAGAAIYRNVTLKNSVVTGNTTIFTGTSLTQDFRAGGIYMDGGTVDACYVINNTLQGWNNSTKQHYGAAYGGGMYIFTGTVFNSVIANNNIYARYADGAAVFIESSNFFNNTIVNNKAEGDYRMAAGIAVWTDPNKGYDSAMNIYNTICVNNEGYIENPDQKQSPAGNENVAIQNGGYVNLYNCITGDIKNYNNKRNNINAVITYHNSSAETIPASLFENLGNYDKSFASFATLNLRVKSSATKAINQGNNAPVIGGFTYLLENYNDMDFAERIQDCRIDIGAYEFNGATSIEPDESSGSDQAIYYVTPEGYGTTNAHDPANAACAAKLQRVLDAAGRYKYLNPGKQVIVKVANSYDFLHPTNKDEEGHDISSTDERYILPTNFTYYATRTTDWTDQDVRVWSIIVPRGVEVWGGYTDVASDHTHTNWTNEDNGFYGRTGSEGSYVYTDRRNITKNPTYFDSYYLNKLEKMDANTYHVVSFTDRIFDINGYAYTKEDFKGKSSKDIKTILQDGSPSTYIELLDNDESHFVHMSDAITDVSTGVTGNTINIGTAETPKYVSNRAVIDGIFVSGGKADAPANSTNTTVNINSYGGAALVNDFAYVRNCILVRNTAINGGALALTGQALVSGCLIKNNEAHNEGGGIYVFEEGTKLSNGTTIQSLQQKGDPTMDYRMAHVLTSTIVQNTAQRGGGVWFSNQNHESVNVRFNSVAIWQNKAPEQTNVYGMVNPEQPTNDETDSEVYYPFAYSLIQNIRASGTDNQSAEALNREGVRFVDKDSDIGQSTEDLFKMAAEGTSGDKYANFGYYGLTRYSILCSTGMPKSMYQKQQQSIAISDVDFLGQNRINANSSFIEIGARALPKVMPNKQLMLRLFVAQPQYVDTKTASQFMRLTGTERSKEEYYSQVGSSFAYPFNFMEDALDYIRMARNGEIAGLKLSDGSDATSDIVRNLPFEIVLGKGTYFPKKSLNGETESVWAHTFAIPEGVTIIGGFNPQGGGGSYYGRYYQAKSTIDTTTPGTIYDNVETLATQGPETKSTTEIGRGNKHGTEDVQLSQIGTPTSGTKGDPGYVEESSDYAPAKTVTFQQWHIQDIADRRAMFDNNKNGIIEPWEFSHPTIISGNAVNGETDGVYHIMTAVADADAVGLLPKVQKENDQFVGSSIDTETGYQWKEQGQQIRLNGLIVTGGNALTYLSTALDDYGSYMYYHGAGLVVDGNRYKNPATTGNTSAPEFHNSAAYGLGYRDIPVSITNCQFRNNIAGYGGAISSNGSLSIFASSFEQNKAVGQTETPSAGEHWYTNITGSKTEVYEVAYPGHGGAIHATNQLSAFNTLFANNEACLADGEPAERVTIDPVKHPTFRVPNKEDASATIRAAGGAIMMGSAAEHHIVNCNFVRNKANAYPAVFTMNPTKAQTGGTVDTHNYSQIINTVAWGNEVNALSSNADYLRASKLLVNIGKKDRDQGYITNKSNHNFYNPSFTEGNVPSEEALENTNPEASGDWQEAVWFCAYEDGMGFKQNNTNDLRDAIVYSPLEYAPTMIKEANGGVYQNCNIQIVADNNDVAGPNFGNPSIRAGFDGFMEGADWSPARFNRLTDQGNGWIKQSVVAGATDFEVTFHNDDKVDDKVVPGTNFQGAYSITHYITDLTNDHQFPEYKLWLAIGKEKYMQATNEQESAAVTINGTSLGTPNKNYPRISPDPTMGVEKAYIDIGVYEYQKQPLLKPGGEVDILWVSTKEHPENGPADGSTWRQPTSDLQKAIETLLQSRNGHKKEIRIMEGVYTPITPKTVEGIGKINAFVIDTKSLNASAITPSGFTDGSNNAKYYAQSLTIKGGYSAEIMYDYDPAQYKTIIRQNEAVADVNTDHLIYIADPTVRYAGKNAGLGSDNATFGSEGEAASAKTMPIQVDGVTLINDRASANTKGSAIYYPDCTGASPITEAHSMRVNSEVTYYTTDDRGNKHKSNVETDDLTTKIYYTSSDKTVRSTDNIPTEWSDESGEEITNPAKLVITKTQVVGSGSPAADIPATASAVYIGQNGGNALIYNSVFHSNYGMPLDAWNTVNVNNTFGLNAGKVQLNGANSEMHNSVLWRNNNGADQLYFDAAVAAGSAKFSYNSYTGATANDTYKLTSLVDLNTNIAEGPNFIDPENDDIEARNFDIKPSARLLNKGSETETTGTYYTKIMHYDLGDSKYAAYDYSLVPTTGVDVMNRPRFKDNIDIGAYEFKGSLVNPLYVDPNKAHSNSATGENWDDAFGYGDIQNAIDLAAIYRLTNNKEGYVFVKGASATNRDLHTGEPLTLRNGVTVYGSIISSYTDWHGTQVAKGGDGADKDDLVAKYTDIPTFITDMASFREGVASHTASETRVTSIRTAEHETYGNDADFPTLLDGFIVTPVSKDDKPTAPVLDLTNSSTNAAIGVRNIIVADNTMSGATDVAQVNNGLLYEALFRDNTTTGATLHVKENGYAVNVTVEGKTIGANDSHPVDGKSSDSASDNVEAVTHIYSSITNSINTGSVSSNYAAGESAPYGSITSPDISGHFYNIGDANLNYQLTETSRYIDQCENTNPLTMVATNLAPFINYTTDRDLLGNPRLLTGVTTESKIDRGAFETWKVKNTTGTFICGNAGTIATADYTSTYDNDAHAIIKQHFYPHDGSVCYIMENQSLVIDPVDGNDVKPTPNNPGFMLLKEGASFYGNSRPSYCAYVAVERRIDRDHGSIIALPYDLKYASATTQPQYDANDRLTGLTPSVVNGIYDYNATARSAWDYIFKTDNTGCWTPAEAAATTPANHGILVEAQSSCFSGSETETIFRFTAKGTSLTDFVYTEDGPSKTVVLTQHDDKESTGGAADFTDKEDMGWNCIGLPYLVSDYRPYEIVTTTDGKTAGEQTEPTDNTTAYRLNLPHTLWLYYDGIKDHRDGNAVNGKGGYYSADSWDSTNWNVLDTTNARIWVGEGIFTQTATTSGSEVLTFYLPDPATIPTAAPSNRRNARYYYGAPGNEDPSIDSAQAPTLLRTEFYDIHGRRIARPDALGVTIVRRIYSDGTVRTAKMR